MEVYFVLANKVVDSILDLLNILPPKGLVQGRSVVTSKWEGGR